MPTLGLFGPSDEQLYGPWGENARVVRGPRSFEQIRAVDPSFGQALCHMMDLPVETVGAGRAKTCWPRPPNPATPEAAQCLRPTT